MALVRDGEWVHLLREGMIEEFNRKAEREKPELAEADLRMTDLRKANLVRANLRGAYMRNADMRALDLSQADLDGASFHDANIAGVLFPRDIPAAEILLSVTHGIRLRASGR